MRAVLAFFVMLFAAGASRLPPPPLGLDLYMPVPDASPLTRETVALGRRLFFDKQLSGDRRRSCATCHDPKHAFSDGRVRALDVSGAPLRRHAPAIVNRGYGRAFFWDGRADTLEQQVLQPIFNPLELALSEAELIRRTRLQPAQVAAALASYVRTIRSGDSPFDRYVAGRLDALTSLQKTGLQVFRGKGNCTACHVGPNFTDERFHNTGLAWRDGEWLDNGRFAVSGVARDRGAFKTPTLRDVARTAPYMHDGSLATLDEVVEFYSNGGRANPGLDPEMRARQFTPDDTRALVAFLTALSGSIREGWR